MLSLARFFVLVVFTISSLAQAVPVSAAVAGQFIPGRWIVTLKASAGGATVASHMAKVREIHARNARRRSLAPQEVGGIERQYSIGNFKGYAGSFDAATIEELRSLPDVNLTELRLTIRV